MTMRVGLVGGGNVTGTHARAVSAIPPVVSDVSGLSVIENFLCAIRENRGPACDGREAGRSVALIEEIYQASARSDERTSAKPVG